MPSTIRGGVREILYTIIQKYKEKQEERKALLMQKINCLVTVTKFIENLDVHVDKSVLENVKQLKEVEETELACQTQTKYLEEVSSITDAVKEKCNKEEDLLQRCTVDLPVLSSPEISFALTREDLDKSCVNLRSGIACINNFTHTCMEKNDQVLFTQIYAGISGVVKQLCTRGSYQDEYLQHAECVKNVRPEYETCSKKYEVTLLTLSSHQKNEQYSTDQRDGGNSHEDYLRTVCCSFQEYLLCSERTVQRTCGDDAAVFTSKFLKQMSSNIIKNFCLEYRDQECDEGGKASHTNYNLQLVLLAISGHLAFYLSGNLIQT